jgi:hypothetical protein
MGLVLPIFLWADAEEVDLPTAVDLANFVPPFVSGGESHNTRL